MTNEQTIIVVLICLGVFGFLYGLIDVITAKDGNKDDKNN